MGSQPQSDQDLMHKLRERDESAFDELMASYESAIRRHLIRMVMDANTAEDLLGEVFLRAWTHAEQWDGRGSLKSWLFRIATNFALNHLRTVRRRREQPLEIPLDPQDDDSETRVPGWMIDASALGPEAVLEAAETRRMVSRLLDDLPEEKREVFRLVHQEEMTAREVSDMLGIPEGTVKSRLHYATKRVADAWKSSQHDEEV